MSGKTDNKNPADTNVDQIRDILFGGQMREYEQRFTRLDERLQKFAQQLRTDLDHRMDQLEAYVRKECDKLTDRVAKQAQDGQSALKQLQTGMQQQGEQVRQQVDDITGRFDSEIAELRDDMHQTAKKTLKQLQDQADDTAAALDRESHELRDSRPAREELASLFNEFALRLNREFDLPDQ